MPIPRIRNIGKTMSFLKREKPGMARKQRTAIALDTARKAGADVPKPGNPRRIAPGGAIKRGLSKAGGQLAAIGRRIKKVTRPRVRAVPGQTKQRKAITPAAGSKLTPAEVTRGRKSLAAAKAQPRKLRTGFAIPKSLKKRKLKEVQRVPLTSTSRAKELGLEDVLPRR